MKFKIQSQFCVNVDVTATRKELRSFLRELGFKGSHNLGGDTFHRNGQTAKIVKELNLN